jgi:hypothetical protein
VTTIEDGSVLLEIERLFVDKLDQCASVREESGRELIVANIGRQLGAELSVRRQTTARMNIIELVRVCAGLPRGLELLTEQIRFIDPLAPELPELRHLCDEWQAAHTLADIWLELRDTLKPLRLTASGGAAELHRLRQLAAIATESRVEELPKQCSTVWRLFVYLVGANAGPGTPPPAMVLLDCLAERVPDPPLARTIRRWNRGLAAKWQITELLDVAAWRTPEPRDEVRAIYLVIQIEPNAMDSSQLLLSHWRQSDPGEWRPQRGEDRTVTLSTLEREVDDLVGGLESMLGASADAARMPDISLEFVLPAELLNFPVQLLRKSALAAETVPLAIDHPVVIRSLERLRMPRLHLAWHRRWARIAKGDAVRPYWSQPSGSDYFVRLAAELGSDQRVFSLILSSPPEEGNDAALLEIHAALRAGIPAILWHRSDGSAGAFRDAVTTMVADGALVHLPERVTKLRRDALRLGGDPPSHPGWGIALLWDDPTRFPEPPRGIG